MASSTVRARTQSPIWRTNGAALPKVVNLLLDANAKQKLYDHVRDEDGTVPVEAVATEIYDIFQNGRQAKNS